MITAPVRERYLPASPTRVARVAQVAQVAQVKSATKKLPPRMGKHKLAMKVSGSKSSHGSGGVWSIFFTLGAGLVHLAISEENGQFIIENRCVAMVGMGGFTLIFCNRSD
jgi:hypothetical protein